MRSVILLSFISLVTACGSQAWAFRPNDQPKYEVELDKHRVAYVDARRTPSGMHIHFKLSNGWRVDPWWVTLTGHFIEHRLIIGGGDGGRHVGLCTTIVKSHEEIIDYTVAFNAKCPASLGGRAHECNYEFDRATGIWPTLDTVKLEGHPWNGVSKRTTGTNDPKQVDVNIPIYRGSW